MSGTPDTVRAPAKLTLSLRIVGLRADGYHVLDAEMITLTLADQLTIDTATTGLAATGPYRDGVPLDERNLVARALEMVGRQARITIDKQIPHGGGLGGGSADAAAVLRWAGHTDLGQAAILGADVPFCLVGGRARVQGIGEIVTAMPAMARDFTLIVPPLSCSTPVVYKAWDDLGGPTADGPNDLLAAALVVEPRLVEWHERIAVAAGIEPTLAGSGATWFLEGHHPHLRDALPEANIVLTSSETASKTSAENEQRPPT